MLVYNKKSFVFFFLFVATFTFSQQPDNNKISGLNKYGELSRRDSNYCSIFEQQAINKELWVSVAVYQLEKDVSTVSDGNLNMPASVLSAEECMEIIMDEKLGNHVLFWPPVPQQKANSNIWKNGIIKKWVDLLSENNIYSSTVYAGKSNTAMGIPSETLLKLKSNKFWMGNSLGEVSGFFYQAKTTADHIGINIADNLADAREQYINHIKNKIKLEKNEGYNYSGCVSAAMVAHETYLGGIDFYVGEMFFGNTTLLLSEISGASFSDKHKAWGAYNPSDWYSDELEYTNPNKYLLLRTSQYLEYMYGATMISLENGLFNTQAAYYTKGSYGMKNFGYDSFVCSEYRNEQKRFYKFSQKNKRTQLRPIIDIAVVKGRLSGFPGWFGFEMKEQPIFGQWENASNDKSWLISTPERGWNRILETLVVPDNHWLSGTPYGQVDIIPAESTGEIFKSYKYLIFPDWNTVDEENKLYKNLKNAVSNGTNVLISVIQFNESSSRKPHIDFFSDNPDYADLIGVQLKKVNTNNISSIKFQNNIYNLDSAVQVITVKGTLPKNIKIIAQSDTGIPVLLKIPLGKGSILLNLLFEWPGKESLKKLMDDVIKYFVSDGEKDFFISEIRNNLKGKNCLQISYTLRKDCAEFINVSLNKRATIDFHHNKKTTKLEFEPGEYKKFSFAKEKVIFSDFFDKDFFLKHVPDKYKNKSLSIKQAKKYPIVIKDLSLKTKESLSTPIGGVFRVGIEEKGGGSYTGIIVENQKLLFVKDDDKKEMLSQEIRLPKGDYSVLLPPFLSDSTNSINFYNTDYSYLSKVNSGMDSVANNKAINANVKTSGSYSGYSEAAINDGILIPDEDKKWFESSWASKENSREKKYIELSFRESIEVSEVGIFWAFDKGKWYSSSSYDLFALVKDKWELILKEKSNKAFVFSGCKFAPIYTRKIRLIQKSGCGSPERPDILWVSELVVR